MKKPRAKKGQRRSSAKLEKLLAEFDISRHGGETMADGSIGVEFPGKSDQNAPAILRYRTVDRKGRIYLQEDLIGRAFRLTAQYEGAWLLEPTDEVPASELWAHAPKIARALERIQSSPTVQYRAVDKRGRIYLRGHLIGSVFRVTEQPDGALLLEPTDAVPPSEHWAHAPKIARALELTTSSLFREGRSKRVRPEDDAEI